MDNFKEFKKWKVLWLRTTLVYQQISLHINWFLGVFEIDIV